MILVVPLLGLLLLAFGIAAIVATYRKSPRATTYVYLSVALGMAIPLSFALHRTFAAFIVAHPILPWMATILPIIGFFVGFANRHHCTYSHSRVEFLHDGHWVTHNITTAHPTGEVTYGTCSQGWYFLQVGLFFVLIMEAFMLLGLQFGGAYLGYVAGVLTGPFLAIYLVNRIEAAPHRIRAVCNVFTAMTLITAFCLANGVMLNHT